MKISEEIQDAMAVAVGDVEFYMVVTNHCCSISKMEIFEDHDEGFMVELEDGRIMPLESVNVNRVFVCFHKDDCEGMELLDWLKGRVS